MATGRGRPVRGR